jgi:hypothetical protein
MVVVVTAGVGAPELAGSGLLHAVTMSAVVAAARRARRWVAVVISLRVEGGGSG